MSNKIRALVAKEQPDINADTESKLGVVQITKTRKGAIEARIAKLNESYALVIVGDKTAILKLAADGGIKFLTHSAFELWHANRFIYYQDKNGDQKKISLAKYWLHHAQRRQYEGIVFAPGREVPGQFNLWRGLAVQPRQGDCSKFLAHLKDNVCRGDEALYLWVVGWFAQIMQHPNKKMGTSLVLRGKQGTGKTKVGQVIGSLLGEHYALVSDPRYVTGRFNSHLVSCLLLHCDESFGPAIMRQRASSRTSLPATTTLSSTKAKSRSGYITTCGCLLPAIQIGWFRPGSKSDALQRSILERTVSKTKCTSRPLTQRWKKAGARRCSTTCCISTSPP
jgi:hypothetical protein